MRQIGGQTSVVRRARWEDVDAILDLLTEYEMPRAYFEPFYRLDPTYQPEQSWLVEADGQLVAHLRVYDRQIRVHPSAIRVAGIGNVITSRSSRGRGYAGQLLQAVREALPREGYAYSLLWTHLPQMYRRYGWAPIEQRAVQAVLPVPVSGPHRIRPFQADDLPDLMPIYERVNTGRTGPTLRTPEYWHAQLAWLSEDMDGFLVARTPADEVVGYVRSRRRPAFVEVLELGCDDPELGKTLLASVAERRNGALRAQLPPSLLGLFHAVERHVVTEPGLMGLALGSTALAGALERVWQQRLASAGVAGVVVRLETGTELRVGHAGQVREPIDEATFAHLLFHGYAGGQDDVLRALFPPQDFVMWPADAF